MWPTPRLILVTLTKMNSFTLFPLLSRSVFVQGSTDLFSLNQFVPVFAQLKQSNWSHVASLSCVHLVTDATQLETFFILNSHQTAHIETMWI